MVTESRPSVSPLNYEVLIQINKVYGFMFFLVIQKCLLEVDAEV